MAKHIHLVKLSVGTDSVEGLQDWQEAYARRFQDGLPRHVTRMWPKKEAEILQGGSMYWVIKGAIQCRQRIVRMDEVIGSDGIRRCGIVLEPQITRTTTATKRPFQGWRYLKAEDAPKDLTGAASREESLPSDMATALAEIGVI